MSKLVPVEITNQYDFAVENRPFRFGLPCAEGAIASPLHLQLACDGQAVPFYATPLATWPDGSLKWCLLDFQTSLKAGERRSLQLGVTTGSPDDQKPEPAPLLVSEDESAFRVDTGVAQFSISKQQAGLFEQVVYDGSSLLAPAASRLSLLDEQGHVATPVVSSVCLRDPENTLRKSINIEGFFQNDEGQSLANFHLELIFFAGLATVRCAFTLSNPQAAEHPGGVWDLGDKGSLFFSALSLQLQLAGGDEERASFIRLSPQADWQQAEAASLKLLQHSSGGENWQSKNHMNFKGEVPLEFRGYRYFEQDVQQGNGNRATPSLHLASAAGGITAYVNDFWQNFPGALRVEQAMLSLDLFPQDEPACYELQGGERKRQTFYLDFSNNKASLDSYIEDMLPKVPLNYYAATKVIPWLPTVHQDSEIQKLIDRGIQGEKNFFDKREAIDEFGWRNFGEIYADHEGLEYKGDDELISHYNNQYDPIYGFIKQYLISGDERWHELLSTLAQHVVDIDIYHTIQDRDEYNGGLFWHTHHYLSAFTCTHRTFSSKHAEDFIYGEIGGGPGAEHCYTTGLSYYYFMTGDEVYKDAALQLVDWLSRVLDGSDTVIERVFQFKSKELPLLKRLVSGESIQRYRYPFTRGTGNYITSLIDAYSLTGEKTYVERIERVIYQSIHPLDDISLRGLDDTESSWSYVIYLQAICKYLDLKMKLQEFDEACFYAKDSLLHYVDWMLENESPFLSDSEKLEYPNHTWAAQDLRKANIFYLASLYSDDKKNRYLEAARFYVRYVEETLKNEDTRYYSRILILLMQNQMLESGLDYAATAGLRGSSDLKHYNPVKLCSVASIIFNFIKDIGRLLFKFSFKKEKRWLSFRVK